MALLATKQLESKGGDMQEDRAMIVRAEQGLALPDETSFKRDIQAINRFQQVAHANLVSGQDYGVIPGTQKPTLLKPGAEKIAKLLGLADEYDILDRQEDWDKPFFRYLVKCRLISVRTGIVISEGLGECNSMESKYRWRDSKRVCPECGAEAIIKGKEQYGGGWICFAKKGGCGTKWNDGADEIEGQKLGRVENEDIYSQVNTILKMAKKRALVDAALSAGRLSNVFTQDIEDTGMGDVAPPVEKPTAKPATQKPKTPDAMLDQFKAQCDRLGWASEQICDWLENFSGCRKWAELTKEAQAKAVKQITEVADEAQAAPEQHPEDEE